MALPQGGVLSVCSQPHLTRRQVLQAEPPQGGHPWWTRASLPPVLMAVLSHNGLVLSPGLSCKKVDPKDRGTLGIQKSKVLWESAVTPRVAHVLQVELPQHHQYSGRLGTGTPGNTRAPC